VNTAMNSGLHKSGELDNITISYSKETVYNYLDTYDMSLTVESI
jgi:hypothetical protein